MPKTRSQSTYHTRSRGPAPIPTEPRGSTRQTKVKSKTSVNPKLSALPSDSFKKKIVRILWKLAEIYYPGPKIVLKYFKRYSETAVLIIVALLLSYTFIDEVTVLWQKPVTADLPSVYFNDASYQFTRCPDEQTPVGDMKRLQDMVYKDGRMYPKQTVFILGSASGCTKSNCANQLGVSLFDSLKQNRQDNRPVDVITINVSSESVGVIRSIYNAILALCGSQKSDCIKQLKEELDLTRDLFVSESKSSETERKLKFLFTKLNEILTRRDSHAVMIFYSWRDSVTKALWREHFGTPAFFRQIDNNVIMCSKNPHLQIGKAFGQVQEFSAESCKSWDDIWPFLSGL